MWTVNEAPPRQFRNQLLEPAPVDSAEANPGKFTYDYWRRQLCLIRAALAPFPLALAAVIGALEKPDTARTMSQVSEDDHP